MDSGVPSGPHVSSSAATDAATSRAISPKDTTCTSNVSKNSPALLTVTGGGGGGDIASFAVDASARSDPPPLVALGAEVAPAVLAPLLVAAAEPFPLSSSTRSDRCSEAAFAVFWRLLSAANFVVFGDGDVVVGMWL